MGNRVPKNFTEIIDESLAEYIKAREKMDYETNLYENIADEIINIVSKSFRNLISKKHISTIGLYDDSKITIRNSGFARTNFRGKTASINALRKSSARSIIADIFYLKKDEVSDWLKTLNNRNKAVYNMHKLFCDALEPLYDKMNNPLYANRGPTHKARKQVVHKDVTLNVNTGFMPKFYPEQEENVCLLNEPKQISGYTYTLFYNSIIGVAIDDGTHKNNLAFLDILKFPQILFLIWDELPNITRQTLEIVKVLHSDKIAIHKAFDDFKNEVAKWEVLTQI
ncbi:hypothetical protein [Acinetobacter sp.]|uniref:hypothetical protein n=1 Tax=Acinetobacter sp. TaxID=472 RepID=UPI003D03D485